jgi:hypothetical protein
MSVMIFKSIRKKGNKQNPTGLWKRAGGSSFFEEPNKIERKSPSLLHDPQAASIRAKRDRAVTSIIPKWRTLEEIQ